MPQPQLAVSTVRVVHYAINDCLSAGQLGFIVASFGSKMHYSLIHYNHNDNKRPLTQDPGV